MPCNLYGLVCDAVGGFKPGAPFVGDPLFALQAPSFPMRLRPLHPPPRLLRELDALCCSLGHSLLLLRGMWLFGGLWRVSICMCVLTRSPLVPSHRLVGGESGRRGGSRLLRVRCDSAASSLPGGRGSGIIALTGVPCARWPWLVESPSHLNSQVGQLGGSTRARWSLPAVQLS